MFQNMHICYQIYGPAEDYEVGNGTFLIKK